MQLSRPIREITLSPKLIALLGVHMNYLHCECYRDIDWRERGSIQVRLWAYLFIYQHKSIISSPDDGINTNNRKRYSDWINITPYRVTVTALDENN